MVFIAHRFPLLGICACGISVKERWKLYFSIVLDREAYVLHKLFIEGDEQTIKTMTLRASTKTAPAGARDLI
ncbi:MAG: hypothetical protein VR65_20100 [Desulfobulbaceae bacterium BRH_c16a]|nr:MAG: hypothetical protein VR65_20100 [Desulfobulbaceae bacterium BRH_c16a]